MRVKFRHVAVAITPEDPATGTLHDSHIVAVDERGRVWERHSYSTDGHWALIDSPDEPTPVQHRRIKQATKR